MATVILEVLDHLWQRKALSQELHSATVTEELGTVGDGSVTINKDDPVVKYLPNPDAQNPYEGRFRIYEDNSVVFAGVIDSTTYTLDSEGNHSFEGKARGIELSWTNFGRRDINGWPLIELFPELLRDNIGKAPLASIEERSSARPQFPALNAITGDPFENQMWVAAVSGSNYFTVDLGAEKDIDSIRVITPWWDKRWYKWNVYTGNTVAAPDLLDSKDNAYPTTDKGILIDGGVTARYVKFEVYDSTDEIARMAAVMIYQDVAEVGPNTTYFVPWIENDDSGNIELSPTGATPNIVVNGAFAGDGIVGNSHTTRLMTDGWVRHTFRGSAEAVYATQDTKGAAAVEVFIDGDSQGIFTVPNNSYQYKVFEIDGLDEDEHTCRVDRISGSFYLDYFTGLYDSSWRVIREDDPSIGYVGTWTDAENENHHNFHAIRTSSNGDKAYYEFYGNRIEVVGSKGLNHSTSVEFYIDGGLEDTVDVSSGVNEFKEVLFSWTGDFQAHTLRIVNTNAAIFELDRIQGNFSHVIYMRSAYDHNLALLGKLSGVVNSYLRFNYTGTVDLLGVAGEEINVVVREGENEGGQITSASVTNDYTDTYSAALALVNGPGNLPIKSFVIDREAVKKMGLKIGKFDESDSVDAFILTRQAWTWLQEHKVPHREYDIAYFEEDGADTEEIKVGDSPRFYVPSVSIDDQRLRIGRKTTTWASDSNV